MRSTIWFSHFSVINSCCRNAHLMPSISSISQKIWTRIPHIVMGQIASGCTCIFFDQDIWMDLYAICAITDILHLQAACSKAWPGFGPRGNKWNWEVNSTPPDWQDIFTYFRGSELQNYFTRMLEDNLKVLYCHSFLLTYS